MGSKYITRGECANCQKYLVEKIDGLRREVKILLGTTTVTVIIAVVQLLMQVR